MNIGLLSRTRGERLLTPLLATLREYRFPIAGSLICGFLAYTYAFTNKLVNLDEMLYLFSKGVTTESGRWGLVLCSYLFPDISMPWIYGVLGLLILTAGICLCIRIFSIKSHILQFLLSGIIITFPSQIATFAYTYTAAPYAVSFLLAVLAVYFLCCGKGSPVKYGLALVCSVLSVSIYQAYISITASLLVLFLVKQIMGSTQSEKQLFRKGLCYVAFLALSLGVYWIITNLIWSNTEASIGGYAYSALTFSPDTILSNIKDAYVKFYAVLRYRHYSLITGSLSHVVHIVCILLTGMELLLWMLHNKKPARILLLLFLLGILPLSINCIFLFIHPDMIHSLVMFAFTSVYLLVAIILENGQYLLSRRDFWNRVRVLYYDVLLACIAIVIACNVYFANGAYLNLYLQYENTYSFTTSVLTTLENTPGYQSGDKVALIGMFTEPEYEEEHLAFLDGIAGLMGISPNSYSIRTMFQYYNGSNVNLISWEEALAVGDTPQFQQMPSYPSYGYIQKIQDVFVIKLSDDWIYKS